MAKAVPIIVKSVKVPVELLRKVEVSEGYESFNQFAIHALELLVEQEAKRVSIVGKSPSTQPEAVASAESQIRKHGA